MNQGAWVIGQRRDLVLGQVKNLEGWELCDLASQRRLHFQLTDGGTNDRWLPLRLRYLSLLKAANDVAIDPSRSELYDSANLQTPLQSFPTRVRKTSTSSSDMRSSLSRDRSRVSPPSFDFSTARTMSLTVGDSVGMDGERGTLAGERAGPRGGRGGGVATTAALTPVEAEAATVTAGGPAVAVAV